MSIAISKICNFFFIKNQQLSGDEKRPPEKVTLNVCEPHRLFLVYEILECLSWLELWSL